MHLELPDTQTGIKLYRRELLDAVLGRCQQQRFAFDLEVFVLARHLGFQNLIDLPVRVEKPRHSTVSARAVAAVVRDTAAVLWRARHRARRR